jgi:hypothetical protein
VFDIIILFCVIKPSSWAANVKERYERNEKKDWIGSRSFIAGRSSMGLQPNQVRETKQTLALPASRV